MGVMMNNFQSSFSLKYIQMSEQDKSSEYIFKVTVLLAWMFLFSKGVEMIHANKPCSLKILLTFFYLAYTSKTHEMWGVSEAASHST